MYAMWTTMATGGILSSVVTSLQRQYGFSSTAMGVLLSLSDAVTCVLAIFVGHYGTRFNKARVSAIGFVASAVGVLLFALPYFISPTYQPTGSTGTQVCDAANTNEYARRRHPGHVAVSNLTRLTVESVRPRAFTGTRHRPTPLYPSGVRRRQAAVGPCARDMSGASALPHSFHAVDRWPPTRCVTGDFLVLFDVFCLPCLCLSP